MDTWFIVLVDSNKDSKLSLPSLQSKSSNKTMGLCRVSISIENIAMICAVAIISMVLA